MIESIKKQAARLTELLEQSSTVHPGTLKVSLLDFNSTKADSRAKLVSSHVRALQDSATGLEALSSLPKNREALIRIQIAAKGLESLKPHDAIAHLNEIIMLADQLVDVSESRLAAKPPLVPDAIRADLVADFNEINACMRAGCFRSATILCGRILEAALHRKYFEVTGLDILEKNPGIGLGNLIAKLVEQNVSFDPGLTQQIHLINQVRVFSVHKKQEAFHPSRAQAEAMVLYTMDAIEKLFARKR